MLGFIWNSFCILAKLHRRIPRPVYNSSASIRRYSEWHRLMNSVTAGNCWPRDVSLTFNASQSRPAKVSENKTIYVCNTVNYRTATIAPRIYIFYPFVIVFCVIANCICRVVVAYWTADTIHEVVKYCCVFYDFIVLCLECNIWNFCCFLQIVQNFK